jgi:hypothetical protein
MVFYEVPGLFAEYISLTVDSTQDDDFENDVVFMWSIWASY